MLDVHPPEHGIHGARDFLVHLLTITVGLLIALGLEQAAEAMHHRHEREEAETTIRSELRENLQDLKQLQGYMTTEVTNTRNVIAYIDARVSGKPADASGLHLQLNMNPMKDSAWRTAAATGVVQYMQYGTAERFAECYKEQEQFEAMEQRVLESFLNVQSFFATKKPAELSDAELRDALPMVRKTVADLQGARDVGRGMDEACKDALKE